MPEPHPGSPSIRDKALTHADSGRSQNSELERPAPSTQPHFVGGGTESQPGTERFSGLWSHF